MHGFMPSQPKIDLKIDPAKRRSQISRRVDNSFPVCAPLVWHAGHADGDLVWLPSMPGMKLACPGETDFDVRFSITYNRQRYLRELEVTGFMPGNKCRL